MLLVCHFARHSELADDVPVFLMVLLPRWPISLLLLFQFLPFLCPTLLVICIGSVVLSSLVGSASTDNSGEFRHVSVRLSLVPCFVLFPLSACPVSSNVLLLFVDPEDGSSSLSPSVQDQFTQSFDATGSTWLAILSHFRFKFMTWDTSVA